MMHIWRLDALNAMLGGELASTTAYKDQPLVEEASTVYECLGAQV